MRARLRRLDKSGPNSHTMPSKENVRARGWRRQSPVIYVCRHDPHRSLAIARHCGSGVSVGRFSLKSANPVIGQPLAAFIIVGS